MMTKADSFMILSNYVEAVEDDIGVAVWSYCLFTDALVDPPRDIDWTDLEDYELAYEDYERFVFDKAEIVGPEEWDEGHYLRCPQCTFALTENGEDVRWIGLVAFGTSGVRIVALEKLGTLWNASTALVPLKQVVKPRTRIPVP